MVVENLLPANWLEKKTSYAFFLGSFYAIIGILIAKLLFPKDPSLVAVAFTSILLLPLLRKLFTIEERQQAREKKFTLKHLFRDEEDFIKVYLLIALGIFAAYTIAALALPGFEVNTLFRDQLELRGAGKAALDTGLLLEILINNAWVLVACFVLSLLTGDGAIFLITWNASLWGTIFGVTAANAASIANTNPWWYLIVVLAIVLPHAILEMLSYILAGISGGLLSMAGKNIKGLFYSYNGVLLITALALLIIGALVETFVLNNATLYQTIVSQSYLYS